MHNQQENFAFKKKKKIIQPHTFCQLMFLHTDPRWLDIHTFVAQPSQFSAVFQK